MSQKKVGVAVIGCGRVGATHMDSVKKCSDKALLAAVIDLDESRAKKAAHNFGTKYYTSVEAALADPKIDAMVVCLSHDQHHPVAMEAMRVGKHVLVEKPLAITYAQAKEMADYSQEKGVVLMTGVDLRHIFALQDLKKRMTTEIGTPFNFLYVMAENFDESLAPPWWQDSAKTGGLVLPMVGSHSIDQIIWFFEEKKPVRVYAEAQTALPPFEGYGEATLLIRFDDGAMATNYISIQTNPPRIEGLIVGPKGNLNFVHGGLYDTFVGIPATDAYVNGEQVWSGGQELHNFAVQMDEFVSAIQEGREPWVKLKQTLIVMRIIEAARESIVTHQPVNL
jgi:predicted dehydrogenase